MPNAPGTDRWWKSPLALLAAASVGFIVVFVQFGSEVLERETVTVDLAIRGWMLGVRTPGLIGVFAMVTRFGAWYSLVAAALVTAYVLSRRGARRRPLVVASVPFILSLIVYVLKNLYGVARPNVAAALTFSFPSGHTSASTAVALVIGYVLRRERVSPRLGLAIAIAVPIAVGISRIVLDMHWASDVLGGWLIGSAYATGVIALYEVAYRRARHVEKAR